MGHLQSTRIRISSLRRAAPGLLLAGLGLAALAVAAGQAFRLPGGQPGPGFVPALIAGALVALGLLQALTPGDRSSATRGHKAGARAGVALCAAVAAFAALLPWAGFLPACWAAGSLALAASPGLRAAMILAGGGLLAGLAAALFLGALGLATPLVGSR
jgi:hypothetical protein